jgi:hypothetical protein
MRIVQLAEPSCANFVLSRMRDRRNPWKWPICIGLALSLVLVTVYLVPGRWIDAFFSPLSLVARLEREQALRWMEIMPPPQVEIVPDHQPETSPSDLEPELLEPHLDPDWWIQGWRIRPVVDVEPQAVQAVNDSVRILLTALGVERDFLSRARPDSLLANRLALLQIEDSFKFDEMKPYFGAMTRARAYADIMSRAADMYDDFLRQEIMTPD